MGMYQEWGGQLGVADSYSQALTPNSTTSSNNNISEQNGDQPRARKLNENCRCQYCGKCFQVNN